MADVRILPEHEFLALAEGFTDQTYEQSVTYARPAAARIGATLQILGVEDGGEIVALALARVKIIPGLGRGIAWIPSGPLVVRRDQPRPDAARLTAILDALRQHLAVDGGHVLRLRLAGHSQLDPAVEEHVMEAAGFRTTERAHAYHSAVMDLSKGEAELLSAAAHKWRSDLRHARKTGAEIDVGNTPELQARFLALFEKVRNTKGFDVDVPPEFFFELAGPDMQVEVVLVHHHGVDLGGCVNGFAGGAGVYLFSATPDHGRKARAGYLLTWHSINRGRELGARTFDLGGIDHRGGNPHVARFKRRLNGTPIANHPHETDGGGPVPRLVRMMERLHARVKDPTRWQSRRTFALWTIAFLLSGCAVTTQAAGGGTTPAPAVTTAAPTTVPSTSAAATTVPPTTVAPTTVAPTTESLESRVTLAFTGDVVAHRAVNYHAQQPDGTYRYDEMFDHLRPFISSFDLAICHLEEPVAPPDEDVIIPPMRLSIAAEITTALAGAGYDRCSTASNHSLDRGAAGVDATVAAFAEAGIGQSGMATSADTVLPDLITVNGIRIAHLSYTFSFNGLPPIAGEEWRSNLIDPQRVIDDARAERARGAEAVIVSFHWGQEKVAEITGFQREVADAVTASGEVDLIVGHHAHVLQRIEQVNGVWVIFGMGNILSNHPTSSEWPASSQDAAVFTTAIDRDANGVITVETPVVYPTWCDTDQGYLVRFTSEADDPVAPISDWLRRELQISEDRTRERLGDYLAT